MVVGVGLRVRVSPPPPDHTTNTSREDADHRLTPPRALCLVCDDGGGSVDAVARRKGSRRRGRRGSWSSTPYSDCLRVLVPAGFQNQDMLSTYTRFLLSPTNFRSEDTTLAFRIEVR